MDALLPISFLGLVLSSLGASVKFNEQSQASGVSKADLALWVLQDTYEGDTFFNDWEFWSIDDPTHGLVKYVDQKSAWKRLAYVTPEGKATMRVDSTSNITLNAKRESVRIQTKKKYNGGLFILDIEHSPAGCADSLPISQWPALSLSGQSWPGDGEIFVIANAQNSTNNQVSWHTLPGCKLVLPGNFTGVSTPNTNCDASVNHNSGCTIYDSSRSSYGEAFNKYNGGVYVMRWTPYSIDVWFFYRNTIPNDIRQLAPDPAQWGLPSASLSSQGCNIGQFFKNQMLIFDITLCGDRAIASFGTRGCDGSCEEQVMPGNNFKEAFWLVNYLHVYQDQRLLGHVVGLSQSHRHALTITDLLISSVFSLVLTFFLCSSLV